jgi:L-malate glycosyltransferase
MKIGIAGPMSLELLNFNKKIEDLPYGIPFPMISMLINGLLKKGLKVVAFTSSPGIAKSYIRETENLVLCVVPQTIHSARYLYKPERKRLTDLMQKYSCDIINAQWSYEFALAALNTDIPTLVTLQDHALTILKLQIFANNSLASKIHWFVRFLMNEVVLKKSKYLSSNSEYLFNLLPNKFRKKTRIINNFYPVNLESDLVPIKKKKNYIISVSSGFSKRKNISTALKAFKIVRENIPDSEYHLTGDDMQENGPAHRFAKENNLDKGVKFLGRISFEEIKERVKYAKIFLHPSKEESFGMAVLESMVLGTVVTGGNKSGNIPKLLESGNVGVLCDINSPKEMASAVLNLYENLNLNDNLRIKALKFVKKNYSEKLTIKKYLSYYSNILNENK